MSEHEDQRVQQAHDAAHAVSEALNVMGFSVTAFAEEICNDHRTIQQSVMRAFVACLREWARANKDGRYDMRNERTVHMAAKIVAAFDDDLFFPII